MARPTKPGLDYFPHDVDLSEDPKVEYLMGVYGPAGYALYLILLERIYKNGYYMDFTKLQKVSICGKLKVDLELLEKMVFDCLEIELFDRGLFDHFCILTSKSIQERFQSCTVRRNSNQISDKFRLVNVDNNSINATLNPAQVYFGTQSKVKESKVKEIREEKQPSGSEKKSESNKTIPPKKPPKKTAKAKVTDIPEGFSLTNNLLEYCKEKGMTEATARHEFEKFVNNRAAKGAKYADWSSAFRNWASNWVSYGSTQVTGKQSSGLTTLERYQKG